MQHFQVVLEAIFTLLTILLRVFLFPNDLQLELEYWAETGEYTEEELHEVIILSSYIMIENL